MLLGEPQLLAEVFRVLVDREPGRQRRDLEQDPARLAEVDRAEVVAVLHGRDVHPGLADAGAPRQVVLVARRPRDVVDGAGAVEAALGGRRVVGPREVAHAIRAVDLGEAQRLGQQRVGTDGAVGPRAHDPGDRVLGRDLRVLGALRRRDRTPRARTAARRSPRRTASHRPARRRSRAAARPRSPATPRTPRRAGSCGSSPRPRGRATRPGTRTRSGSCRATPPRRRSTGDRRPASRS